MKKTYNINLNGQVFCIDDDACLKLQSYIDTLESHYLKEEDGREIMADIESRIAELLKEVLGKGYKQVVTMEDITDEEKKTKKEQAQEILDKMKEDPTADMSEIAKGVDDKICKQRKEQLKNTTQILDEILSEGTISDINLRMLVKRIFIHQNEDKSLDIRFEMNGEFNGTVSVFIEPTEELEIA